MDTGVVAPKDQFQDSLRLLTEEIFRLRETNDKLKAELEMRHKQVASAIDDVFNRPECKAPIPEQPRRY